MKPHYCSDLATFLAYSLALEQEAAERLHELSGAMMVHNNLELHSLLSELVKYSEEHADSIAKIAQQHQLPPLKPWEFEWEQTEAPETVRHEVFHYLMTANKVLTEVYTLEKFAADFYQNIANTADDHRIAEYAREFAAEERQHADYVKQRMTSSPVDKSLDQFVDWDPPSTPE